MPPVLPPPPAAAAAPAHRPRPHTPPNCKDPELQALAPPPSSASPPFPTSITPSPVAASRVPRNARARTCMVVRGCIGILDQACAYVQEARDV